MVNPGTAPVQSDQLPYGEGRTPSTATLAPRSSGYLSKCPIPLHAEHDLKAQGASQQACFPRGESLAYKSFPHSKAASTLRARRDVHFLTMRFFRWFGTVPLPLQETHGSPFGVRGLRCILPSACAMLPGHHITDPSRKGC